MVYGFGTRSYNRSTERRQNKLACKQTTKDYLEGRLILEDTSAAFLFCRCDEREFPHDPHWEEYPLFEKQRSMNYMGRLTNLSKLPMEDPENPAPITPLTKVKSSRLSPQGRANIAAAQEKRWAKYRGEEPKDLPLFPTKVVESPHEPTNAGNSKTPKPTSPMLSGFEPTNFGSDVPVNDPGAPNLFGGNCSPDPDPRKNKGRQSRKGPVKNETDDSPDPNNPGTDPRAA